MYVATALTILFSHQTNPDLLDYYLPTADFLMSKGIPDKLSTSLVDGTFGYPRAEYLVLGLTSLLGEFRIYGIKFILCIKVAGEFWLAYRIAVSAGTGTLLPVAMIAPASVMFLSSYTTDHNAILGGLALFRIWQKEGRGTFLWCLVGYAALSKYTFWPLLPPFYLMLLHRRQICWPSFVPVILIVGHLSINFIYYGNPVATFLTGRLGGLSRRLVCEISTA
jgi:hypothetical protein